MFYFQAKKKKKEPKKRKFQLKFEKKKNCNKAKQRMASPRSSPQQAQDQAHGKPNRLQRKKTHGFSKKKKKNQYRVDQYIRNLKSVHQKSLKLKQT